jgi:hypothetical protein
MKDYMIIHKDIVDDWKFKDADALKLWLLLLVEEKDAPKDKLGFFVINNLNQTAKKAGVERGKVVRLLHKMEEDGTLVYSPTYLPGTKSKISFEIAKVSRPKPAKERS